MKIQDIGFIIVYAILIYKGGYRGLVIVGMLFLLLSMPLFGLWIFFTAERLVWYAALLFLSAGILRLFQLARKRK